MPIRRFSAVRPEEARGVVWSFLYFFFLLSSYYLLRPLREARGIGVGVEKLPYLYTATFLLMLVVAPAWASLVSRVSRRRLLPLAYRFFALNMLGFYLLSRAYPGYWLVSAAFYVWLSVFNLTAVTVFWSFMADVWRTEQGKRLFGLITLGGSLGAVVGPILTTGLVEFFPPEQLLFIAAILLEAGTFCLQRVARWEGQLATGTGTGTGTGSGAGTATADDPVGGGVLSGLRPVIRSPYLRATAGYMLVATLSGTFNYYLQARLAAQTGGDQATLTQLFARIDLFTNLITAAVQGLLAGRVLTRWGVAPALALLPLVSGIGFAATSFQPLLGLVAAMSVARRASSYGLTIPAYGVIFTAATREEKYKARPFIDLVVYRGGDLAGGWLFTMLLSLGLGLPGVAVVGALLAAPWLALSRLIGRQHRALAGRTLGVD